MNLIYGTALLFILVLLELWYLHFIKKEEIPWREVVFNLNSGHILMWVFRGLEISAYILTLDYFSINLLTEINTYLLWTCTFILWDFFFYWLHRFHHYFELLWAVHVVHHEGEHFSLSLGIRNSWFSSLTSFPFFVVLAILGVPVEVFIATSSVHYFIQFYNHNRIVEKSGFLEKVFITPSHHRVHHGVNPEYVDKNFGGTFILWDKLFGTFQEVLPNRPIIYGTKEYKRNYEVFWANIFPFLKLSKKALPINTFSTPQKPLVYDYIIALGGGLLFNGLLYYIYTENTWSFTLKFEYFTLIFLGTIALGGISENKKWGIGLWAFVFICLSPLFYILNQIEEPALLTTLFLLFIHTLYLLKCSTRR